MGEQIIHLADPNPGDLSSRQMVQQGRSGRRQTKIPPVAGAFPSVLFPPKRPCYHPGHAVLALQQLTRGGTRGVQLCQRNGVLVRRDLKDTVRGGVDNPTAGPAVLRPVLLQHRGA